MGTALSSSGVPASHSAQLGLGGPLGPVLSSRPLPPALFLGKARLFYSLLPCALSPVRSVPPLLFCSLRSLPIFFPLPLVTYACLSSVAPLSDEPSLYIWLRLGLRHPLVSFWL